MGFLVGKKALIVGIANKLSIAYGIASVLHREGAKLAFTYQNDKLKSRVEALAINLESSPELCFRCDVTKDLDIKRIFNELTKHWNNLDIIIHSVGFSPSNQLNGDFLNNISREGFSITNDISVYSFIALAKASTSINIMSKNSCLLTLSYIGAKRVIPNYNVMGIAKASLEASVRYLSSSLGQKNIRVNAISAGPIRTLAAYGIKNFRNMLSMHEKISPLRRNITLEEIGNASAFLCSDLASGITGEILYVDAGFHITSVGLLDN